MGLVKGRSGTWYKVPTNNYKEHAVFIPDELKEWILAEYHGSTLAGHPGIDKMRDLIHHDFWWPTLVRDARTYVQGCDACQ